MQIRQLGRVGPAVSAVGLGCMPMSGSYGSADDADAVTTIRRAIDLGVTLLDTADAYGDGHNEMQVGRAIKGLRDRVVVATKFGRVPAEGRPSRIDGRPEHVRRACDASLRRLGIDTIDLYQQHRVDPDTPIEDTVGALGELVTAGKIRYIGLSEARPADIRRAAATHPITSLQSEYSLFERAVEGDVLDTCAELGIGFLAFAPLVRGLLGGSLRPDASMAEGDSRRLGRFPRVAGEHLAANARLADEVKAIASERHATMAQIALAWLLSRKPWVVPIPGTKRVSYLEENAAAAQLELAPAELARLDALADRVSGQRYASEAQTPNWVSPSRVP